MLAKEFIIERRKKLRRKPSLKKYYFGYGYYGNTENSSGETGDGGGESVYEGAVDELRKRLPSLKKHNLTTIERLVKSISIKHKINQHALERLFSKKFDKTPSQWLASRLDEHDAVDCDLEDEVNKFAHWASKKLSLKVVPKIQLSMDTQEAQDGHHTGSHKAGSHEVWVYAKNRNLVDILRTVFHELVHVRQGELNMIKDGDSYPGSAIEAMADAMAGKYIKIYGEKNHHIFQ